MKNLFTVIAVAFLTFGVTAQQTKPVAKDSIKKEAKKSTTEGKTKCAKSTKSCCSKKA